MARSTFERWIEQCEAARGIEDQFGTVDAMKYLVGEKTTGESLFSLEEKDPKTRKKKSIPIKPKFLSGDELTEPAPPKDFVEPKLHRTAGRASNRQQQVAPSRIAGADQQRG